MRGDIGEWAEHTEAIGTRFLKGGGQHAVGVCDCGMGARSGEVRALEGRAEAVAGTLRATRTASALRTMARMRQHGLRTSRVQGRELGLRTTRMGATRVHGTLMRLGTPNVLQEEKRPYRGSSRESCRKSAAK